MSEVVAAKNASDKRQWLLSKLRPDVYGDRLQLSGNAAAGATINVYLPGKASDHGATVIDTAEYYELQANRPESKDESS